LVAGALPDRLQQQGVGREAADADDDHAEQRDGEETFAGVHGHCPPKKPKPKSIMSSPPPGRCGCRTRRTYLAGDTCSSSIRVENSWGNCRRSRLRLGCGPFLGPTL